MTKEGCAPPLTSFVKAFSFNTKDRIMSEIKLDEQTGLVVSNSDAIRLPLEDVLGVLVVSGNVTEKELNLIKNESTYHTLSLSRCTVNDLNFLLENAPNLKKLRIQGGISDITALERMRSLVSLEFNYFKKTKKVDFSKIKKLEQFLADPYVNGFNSIFDAGSLRVLYLAKYQEKDLKKLANLKNLEELHLNFGSLTSLDGIEELPLLRTIKISYLKNLVNIRAIEKLKNLSCLEIAKTSKLTANDIIDQIPTAVKYRRPMVFHTDSKDYEAIPIENGGKLKIT